MPRVDNDNLGRRRFQIQQEKAVEGVFEKIRRHVAGEDWFCVTPADAQDIKRVLGEVWITVGRQRWEEYQFARIARDDVIAVMAIAREYRGKTLSDEAVTMLESILQKTV